MKAREAVKFWMANKNTIGGSLWGYLSTISKEVNSRSPWVDYEFSDSVVRIYSDGSKSYWLA